MTITLPKDLKGFAFDRVLFAEMNSFDIERFLPSLFFKVVSEGQQRGRRANDPTRVSHFSDRLADHPDVEGFSGEHQRKLLDRFVRTSLIHVGRKGESGNTEQIAAVDARTLLCFKPGFPSEGSAIRRVDTFLYRLLREDLGDSYKVQQLFRSIFGKGVTVEPLPEPGGTYDGSSTLDTLARLSIAYLDGFDPTGVRKPTATEAPFACPGLTAAFASDLTRYLVTYQRAMPLESLIYHFESLINFELFVTTVKLFQAIPRLVSNPHDIPPAMLSEVVPSAPDIYADFTGLATGQSREMAVSCARRDVGTVEEFVKATLTLRAVDRYIGMLRDDPSLQTAISEVFTNVADGPGYLAALIRALNNDSLRVWLGTMAKFDEQQIRRANRSSAEIAENDLSATDSEMDRIVNGADTQIDRVVRLLVASQTQISGHTIGWFWSVGGLTKPHGILAGHLKNRNSWRYAPSNDLLATLVQLAAVDIPDWDEADPRPQPIKLRDFLDWLERRFGIFVDKPPEPFHGPDYVAAAQENLRAMLRRLQQMGIFRDLSDDFTVQELIPPYTNVEEHVSS